MAILEVEMRKEGEEKVFEEITLENFSNLLKNNNIHTQVAQ